jgi:hypothetical protein
VLSGEKSSKSQPTEPATVNVSKSIFFVHLGSNNRLFVLFHFKCHFSPASVIDVTVFPIKSFFVYQPELEVMIVQSTSSCQIYQLNSPVFVSCLCRHPRLPKERLGQEILNVVQELAIELYNTPRPEFHTNQAFPHWTNPNASISALVTSAKVKSSNFFISDPLGIFHSMFLGVRLVIG